MIAVALVVLVLVGWRMNVVGIRMGPQFGSVAATFDDALPYPGFIWTRDGVAVSPEELNTIAGPDHCQWQAATFLHTGWPPGTVARDASRARQYIRDPKGALFHDRSFQARFIRNVTLPADAKPTGHRLGAIQLFVSPSEQDQWIYLVSPVDIEQWPRSDPMTLCM